MSGEIDEAFRPSRLRSLLDHFAVIEDPREPPKVRYPLREVLFLVALVHKSRWGQTSPSVPVLRRPFGRLACRGWSCG